MKATELRIGNLVTINNEIYHPKIKDIIMEIVSIEKTPPIKNHSDTDYGIAVNVYGNKDRITDPEYSQFIRYVEPIKLTEKLLIDFGFEKSTAVNNTSIIVIEAGILDLTPSDIMGYHVYIEDNWICTVKYVHQLQNLYHALTGQELKNK